MDPLTLMKNDVVTLRKSSEKVFQMWNDSVSERLNSQCLGKFQNSWNDYLTRANYQLNRYMNAEKDITELAKKINELMK